MKQVVTENFLYMMKERLGLEGCGRIQPRGEQEEQRVGDQVRKLGRGKLCRVS